MSEVQKIKMSNAKLERERCETLLEAAGLHHEAAKKEYEVMRDRLIDAIKESYPNIKTIRDAVDTLAQFNKRYNEAVDLEEDQGALLEKAKLLEESLQEESK